MSDDDAEKVSAFDTAHRLRVLTVQCQTCILRPGNPMHLQPGRLAELMSEALREGCQGMICHDTLPGLAPDGYAPAVCRGFYDRYGPRNNCIRVMGRLGGITEIAPPERSTP
jgi:hypothetical protein